MNNNTELILYGFDNIIKKTDEYAVKLRENFIHFINIQKIVETYKDKCNGCESYFGFNNPNTENGMKYLTSLGQPGFYEKQLRLYNYSKKCNNVLEIGVNTGHSLFIMLLANPEINIVANDICILPYVEDCIEYLNKHFNNRITFFKGDSRTIIPGLINNHTSSFDLIHIDAAQDYEYVYLEIQNTLQLAKEDCYYIFDDYANGVQKAVEYYIDNNKLFPVEINNFHNSVLIKKHFNYNVMYPIIPIDILNNTNYDNNFKEYITKFFDIEQIYNKIEPSHNKILFSTSLFCQNVDNTYENQYPAPDHTNTTSKWYHKYLINIIERIKEINNSTYNLRIYLEKKLEYLIPILLSYSTRNAVEIYLMKNNSVGAQPGTLWRWLPLNDISYHIIFAADIDETFSSKYGYLNSFMSDNTKALGRYVGWYKDDIIINNRNKVDNVYMKNYTPVLGSRVAARPAQMTEIDIKQIMINYICYNNEYLKKIFTYNTSYNQHGFIWSKYGADERFWKHTLFPYFASKGKVQSWLHFNKMHANKSEWLADFELLDLYAGNTYIQL